MVRIHRSGCQGIDVLRSEILLNRLVAMRDHVQIFCDRVAVMSGRGVILVRSCSQIMRACSQIGRGNFRSGMHRVGVRENVTEILLVSIPFYQSGTTLSFLSTDPYKENKKLNYFIIYALLLAIRTPSKRTFAST